MPKRVMSYMILNNQRHINASAKEVFAALNDTETLKRAIPGCESLEKIADDKMKAQIRLKIGPVNAAFKGIVTLSDIVAPHSWTISGEGSGAAGIAKGTAKVRIAEHKDGGVIVQYEVDVQISGKIAQVGSRLIDSVVAKKLAAQFLKFRRSITTRAHRRYYQYWRCRQQQKNVFKIITTVVAIIALLVIFYKY